MPVTINGNGTITGANSAYGKAVALATATSSYSAMSGTAAQLTGMSATFTAVAGRQYRATFYCSQIQGTNGDRAAITVNVNGSDVQQGYFNLLSNGYFGNLVGLFTGSGSTTVRIYGTRDIGTGTVTLYASAAAPMTLLIEDIGAV